MSKIGQKPIPLDPKTQVTADGQRVVVKGVMGELQYELPTNLVLSQEGAVLYVKPIADDPAHYADWGLWRSILANAVEGVEKGFTRQLELVGVGYRVQKKGNDLELEIGFSHKVDFVAPAGVTLDAEKGVITVKGIDKQIVGQVAANIRRLRPPEPYKGKGVRYMGEVVKLKPGKSAKAGAA